MKRVQRKDFFREIRKSLNRFISILLMTALGVAFYAGVRSAGPDMRITADKLYDETRLMDIRVVSSMGLTEEDLSEIRGLSGVELAESAMQTEAVSTIGETSYILQVFSLGKDLNRMKIKEGRLPEVAGECFVDTGWLRSADLSLGDEITLSGGKKAADGTETDLSETLNHETYTIVGFGDYSWYLNFNRGTANIGDGKADAFLCVLEEDFYQDPEAVQAPVYHNIYIRVKGADELNCYLDEYEEKVDEVVSQIEAIADARCDVRYLAVKEDAESKLNDAKAEIADGEKEIAEAEKKLADGQKELDDAEKELGESREQLDDAWTEYHNGMSEYEQKQSELAVAEETLLNQKEEMEAGQELLQASGVDLDPAAAEELKEAGQIWQDSWNRVQAGKWELSKAYTSLTDAKAELEEGEEKYQTGKTEFDTARAEYLEKKPDAQKEISDAKAEIADAKNEVMEAEADLEKLEKPEWIILKRSDCVQNFIEFGQDAERIGAIGKVFPALFFLVAALVCLTTMTRMVEEERIQIGTLKALGYSKGSVAAKYIWYALSACLIGGIIGVFSGSYLFPYVIIKAYQILYVGLPEPLMPIQWNYAVLSIIIAVLCTVLATALASFRELSGVPAELMRQAAPKQGKRVFLERITIIWKHLNFTWKSTMRNLFRYKKRLFMTIFGIGGSMALLMVGFGLKDSIQAIVDNQYRNLWTYDVALTFSEDLPYSERLEYSRELCEKEEEISKTLCVRSVSMEAEGSDGKKDINLFVPQNLEELDDFLVLRDRIRGGRYHLQSDGVIISEKLADLLSLSVGDSIYLVKSDTEKYAVKITEIAENYLYHYVYMTADLYENVFGEAPVFNQMFYKLSSADADKEEIASRILTDERITGLMDVKTLEAQVANMMNSLNLVIWVLIASAGLLAFVVLYNLNNISIMERRRELATLKVLGFYDMEVAEYVYRENVLLTVLGILVGTVLGILLHQFVIRTCEIDMVMFGRRIWPLSYVFSILLTILFAAIVNFGMFYKLRKIDMVESLKSIE